MITIAFILVIVFVVYQVFLKGTDYHNETPLDDSSIIVEHETPQEIGLAFEKACTELFDKRFYELHDWRSDKYHNGVYAKTSSNPDIVYTLRKGGAKFSIECKYRSKANKWIKLGEEYNLKNYRKFQAENQIPVFIVLGVGGHPNRPEELYTIPLNEIQSNLIPHYKLKKYRKYKLDKGFYYDPESQLLK